MTDRSQQVGQQPRSLDRGGQRPGSGAAERDYVFGRNSTMVGGVARNGGDLGANSDRYLLRDRYRGINVT